MDKNAYLQAFRTEADAFIVAVERGLDARVPPCPAWTVGQLGVHLGSVYSLVSAVTRAQAVEREDVKRVLDEVNRVRAEREADPEFARSPKLVDWIRSAADAVEVALRDADPAQSVWTLGLPHQTAGFWHRRMAQETAVHRWDAESAHGAARPIDRALAVDGIDETMTALLPRRRRQSQVKGEGETYLVRATDTGDVWRVRFDGDAIELGRNAAPADLTMSGAASDVLLVLWQRLPPGAIQVDGDPAKLDRYFELVPPN